MEDLFGFAELKDENEPMPDGIYPAFVDKAEFKISKAGAEYLNVIFKVMSGDHKGRAAFAMYNIFHPNEKPRNIALNEIKRMLGASGFEVDKIKTKVQLLEAVLETRCQIKLKAIEDDYGKKNVVKGYIKLPEDIDFDDATDIPF